MSATIESLKLPSVVKRETKSDEPKPAMKEPEITEQKTPLFKRSIVKVALAIIALVLLTVGLRYYLHGRAYETTDNAFIEGSVVQLSPKVGGYVTSVAVKDNQHVNKGDLLLEIDSRDYENRLAQAKAQLQAAQARQKTAQMNVALTRATTSASVQQAAAGLNQARSNVQSREAQLNAYSNQVAKAQAQVTTQISNVAQARAQLTSAEAEAVRAHADAQRYQQLFTKDEVSRQQFDTAQAAARSSAAKVEAARAAVTSAQSLVAELQASERAAQETLRQAQSQVGESQAMVGEAAGKLAEANSAPQQIAVSRAQVDTASADIAEAEAAVAQAELDLSHTKIYAPEAGTVTKKGFAEGTLLAPGQPLLALVPDELYVIANFKETQLTLMRPGQPVEIKVDAYPGKVFAGKVQSIQAGSGAAFSLMPPENATGNYVKVVQRVPVKIVFTDPVDKTFPLGPGMSVEPEVKVK
ncbi:MAG: HlyD family secretion protein [Acidobacteria bacterium]|nr:HlyD family secretion protein [Acidobacteriota bacterium]